MRILGLIPARGGSKRLPGKNMMEINCVPLVGLAIRHAAMSGVIDKIVVSTEDKAISHYAEAAGAEVLVRPVHLADDDTPMLDVVRHAMDFSGEFDAVMLLQPTSPFRTGADIVACVRILESTGADSVVSVTQGPDDLAFQVRHAGRLERIPSIVVPNGAVYILRTAALLNGETWYSGHAYAYQMPKDRSIDIDTPMDLEIARFMARKSLSA